MRLTLPDDLADQYLAHALTHSTSVETAAHRQLDRFAAIDPFATQVVILGPDHLDRLAARLHGGDIKDGADLVAKVDRLAGVSFMGIDLRLTPAQLDELVRRAERQGKSVEDLVKDIWQRLSVDFFHAA